MKILEMQQQLGNVGNYQSRIVEVDSFTEYLQYLNKLDNRYLQPEEFVEVYEKFVDYENQIVTFMFERKINEKWIEFTHFAQVVSK